MLAGCGKKAHQQSCHCQKASQALEMLDALQMDIHVCFRKISDSLYFLLVSGFSACGL